MYVCEEFAVVTRAVGAEVLQDASERCWGHADLEEVVAERDLYLVNSVLSWWKPYRSPTMESLAPLSPRKDRGSSETPS